MDLSLGNNPLAFQLIHSHSVYLFKDQTRNDNQQICYKRERQIMDYTIVHV